MFGFLKEGFQKIKQAMSKTRSALSHRIRSLFGKPWNEETFEALEQILFEADLGSECASLLVEKARSTLRLQPKAEINDILKIFYEYTLSILQEPPFIIPKHSEEKTPHVILIVGVNGSGKTTSLAKLAYQFKKQGKKVLIGAADTFRAAATEQLELWANQIGVDIVKGKTGADPSAIVFDTLTAAKARSIDIVLIDTAGRLQNKTALMQELEKIKRVMQKPILSAPHETLLVLDATTGQNAIDQAETFHKFTPLTGIIMSKLDGSAKGGIVLSIYKKLHVPIQWIGTGEKVEDLEGFEPIAYASSLFEIS
ncbi:signal recognition particle-docking protein FtsY [Candidatus Rhabdochlamydia sp. T3358]|uniref:signal recognition particle-docking protein FtsY n=1 Tax=Candidatus Rhabdochlamydia sp. T3358 TaxID=2099795 RepID=UPI0010B3B4F6|nr:signal recognition particle-docking protein FtsY [Candidatus Rhabdochlamydia sp. T3358]VHO02120.1 Signal recognition particle receptor FtsY [Candidatus Rhabdochlamydia sp. T3358]